MNKLKYQHVRILTGTHFLLGNHAVIEEALVARCDFCAGKPFTSNNEISDRMAKCMPLIGSKFLQWENEPCSMVVSNDLIESPLVYKMELLVAMSQ